MPLILIVLLSLMSASVTASDTSSDNACYDGGALENQCVTFTDWVCGWELARSGAMPAGCASHLNANHYALGDPRENACNTGAAMAEKCDSDWAWTCGWYLAQWNNAGGAAGNYIMPSGCLGLISAALTTSLPPTPTPLPPYPSAGCIPYYGYFIDFGGGWQLSAGQPAYTDSLCSIAVSGGTTTPYLVYAPAPYNGDQLCMEAFGAVGLVAGYNTNICDV